MHNLYFGVVEDVQDPLRAGRVKVRVWGLHEESEALLPAESLPWSSVATGTDTPSTNEVGNGPHRLEVGNWVFGMFIDGEEKQNFLVMGTFWGKNDPNRNFKGEASSIHSDNDGKRVSWNTVKGESIQQPDSAYNPEYPFNFVKRTSSGHIEEFDDTPNNERIHIQHKSGTFETMIPSGDRVLFIEGEDYQIVLENNNLYVGGNLNINVNGNADIKVEGNLDSRVNGNVNISSGGNMSLSSDTSIDINAPRIDLN
jgi:hypothetical protein